MNLKETIFPSLIFSSIAAMSTAFPAAAAVKSHRKVVKKWLKVLTYLLTCCLKVVSKWSEKYKKSPILLKIGAFLVRVTGFEPSSPPGAELLEAAGSNGASRLTAAGSNPISNKAKKPSGKYPRRLFGPSDWIRTSGLLNPIYNIIVFHRCGKY